MCGRWVEIPVYTFKAFFQETKTGLTKAIWTSVHPSEKQSEEEIKYQMMRGLCYTVQVNASEGQNQSQDDTM